MTGAKLVPVETDPRNGFHLDKKALEQAITPRTRAIYFASPNNPTGVIFCEDELQFIAELAVKHDLWVISDEVYRAMTFGKNHYSIAGFENMGERTVTINSLSKSHAMTGWRIGWVIGPTTLIEHLVNVSVCMLFGLPGFIQEAGLVALTKAKDEVTIMRDVYQRRRDMLLATFSEIDLLDCIIPDASMFLLVNVSKTGMSASAFADRLFDETGVAVLDTTAFGKCAENFVRISYTISDEQLAEACKRIKRFMLAFQAMQSPEVGISYQILV